MELYPRTPIGATDNRLFVIRNIFNIILYKLLAITKSQTYQAYIANCVCLIIDFTIIDLLHETGKTLLRNLEWGTCTTQILFSASLTVRNLSILSHLEICNICRCNVETSSRIQCFLEGQRCNPSKHHSIHTTTKCTTQPPCFFIKRAEIKVCRLLKALYGLTQAPRAWNAKIHAHLLQLSFVNSPTKNTLYVRKDGGK